MPYAARVREFLEEVTARAGGKIRLQVIDPQPFSEDEDRAAEAGLQPLQAGDGTGGSLYFGLAGTNSTDGRSAIPSFHARPRGVLGVRRRQAHSRACQPRKSRSSDS